MCASHGCTGLIPPAWCGEAGPSDEVAEPPFLERSPFPSGDAGGGASSNPRRGEQGPGTQGDKTGRNRDTRLRNVLPDGATTLPDAEPLAAEWPWPRGVHTAPQNPPTMSTLCPCPRSHRAAPRGHEISVTEQP